LKTKNFYQLHILATYLTKMKNKFEKYYLPAVAAGRFFSAVVFLAAGFFFPKTGLELPPLSTKASKSSPSSSPFFKAFDGFQDVPASESESLLTDFGLDLGAGAFFLAIPKSESAESDLSPPNLYSSSSSLLSQASFFLAGAGFGFGFSAAADFGFGFSAAADFGFGFSAAAGFIAAGCSKEESNKLEVALSNFFLEAGFFLLA
jgi:hypothetical protein